MGKLFLLLQLLILGLVLAANDTLLDQQAVETEPKLQINQQRQQAVDTEPSLQINQQRLQEINFLIRSYFQNCELDLKDNLLYGCSIKKQNYAQFLYGLFHKQLIISFLKLYNINGNINQQNQLQSMLQIGDRVHQMVVTAYNDWIQIYKPNDQISIQEMYQDIPQLDQNVLDIIQHNLQKHQDFVNVLQKIYQIQIHSKKYIVMGNKSEEQIAQQYSDILSIYFGQCAPVSQCTIPLNRFVYFVKQLAFYITPLTQEYQNKYSILVSEQMDFRATEFLIKQIDKIKNVLGDSVDLNEIKQYSEKLATSLFQHLKDHQDGNSIIRNKTAQSQIINDQNQL